MSKIEKRIAELGLELPEAPSPVLFRCGSVSEQKTGGVRQGGQ